MGEKIKKNSNTIKIILVGIAISVGGALTLSIYNVAKEVIKVPEEMKIMNKEIRQNIKDIQEVQKSVNRTNACQEFFLTEKFNGEYQKVRDNYIRSLTN